MSPAGVKWINVPRCVIAPIFNFFFGSGSCTDGPGHRAEEMEWLPAMDELS